MIENFWRTEVISPGVAMHFQVLERNDSGVKEFVWQLVKDCSVITGWKDTYLVLHLFDLVNV